MFASLDNNKVSLRQSFEVDNNHNNNFWSASDLRPTPPPPRLRLSAALLCLPLALVFRPLTLLSPRVLDLDLALAFLGL